MKDSPFKKSSLNEMCKQIKSAPVLFKMLDGTGCLAFYNDEDSIKATKLYIMFPNSCFPKYIEGNDLYNIRNCVIHGISRNVAQALYDSINKTHRKETVEVINSLIAKAPHDDKSLKVIQVEKKVEPCIHTVYNRKHACAWVSYNHKSAIVFLKDLLDKKASEIVIDGTVEYNVTLDCVYWAAGISSKDFTAVKAKIKEVLNA